MKKCELEEEKLKIAFRQGAEWWEWEQKGATMFPSDREKAYNRADVLLNTHRLGIQKGFNDVVSE